MPKSIIDVLIFLFIASLFISDYYIVRLGIPSQTVLIAPLLILLVSQFRNQRLRYVNIIIASFLIILGLNSIGQSVDSITYIFYRHAGNAMMFFVLLNSVYSVYTINKGSNYFYYIGSILAFGYYLSLWETNFERATIAGYNENYLANILVLSIAIILSFIPHSKSQKRRLLFILAILIAVPTVLIISRAGIASLIITFAALLIFSLKRSYLTNILIIGTIIIAVSTLSFEDIDNHVIEKVSKRFEEAEYDPRNEWRIIGFNTINQHIYKGVGYDNLLSDEWAIKTGFYKYQDSEIQVASPHNGYIDLGLIGGYPLILLYVLLALPLSIYPVRIYFSYDTSPTQTGTAILCISIFFIIFIYTFTGQANTAKYTWWALAMCYMRIYQSDKDLKPVETSVG